jgi:hypothetical protein
LLLIMSADGSDDCPKEVFDARRTILLTASAALAAEPMAPNDIQATFFNGQPFTASTPGGTKFRMTFTPSGKMVREPLAQSGHTDTGTWKLNAKGFCTTWLTVDWR